MSFWTSGTGVTISGTPDKAFVPDFAIISEGTMALATIKTFETVHKEANNHSDSTRFLQITYKLVDGEFKNREVNQKIKVFDGKLEQIDRNLNMLKLVMTLCNYTPKHNNAPTEAELSTMCGTVVGIKIGEWSMPKADGSGMMEGNFVREVHPSAGFVCESGIKSEVVRSNSAVESAFSRNEARKADTVYDGDIPF